MNGAYNSVSESPEYDFAFAIKEMSIPASFDAFNTVKKMAPMARTSPSPSCAAAVQSQATSAQDNETALHSTTYEPTLPAATA